MSTSLLSTVSAVVKKELKDHYRDRRTVILVLVLSVALGPIMLAGLAFFFSSMEKKAETKEIFVFGQQNAPALVNFMQRQDMTLKEPKPDFRELVKQGKHDPVLVVPEGFSEKLLTGEAKIELVYDDTRQDSGSMSIRVLRNTVRGFNSEVSTQRLIARGVSPSVLRPVEIVDTNMGQPAQRLAGLLIIIPWIALIGCVSAAFSMAIDLVAGERERGSLEPLLMTPTDRLALAIGKSLAVGIYSLVVAALTLLGFGLTLQYGNLPSIGSMMSLSPAQYAGFGLLIFTFGPAMAALLMFFAGFGRSFKEGQTYGTYFLQAIALMPVIAMLAQFKDAMWQLFVPVLGQLMVITRILRNEPVDFIHYFLPTAICVGLFVFAVVMTARLLKQEKVIFGRS
jgi:sodium transport system permease protein